MKTDDLIRALAADGATRQMSLRQMFAAAMIPGVVIAACLFLATLGPRPHFFELLTEPRFAFKICLALLLAALSASLVKRLGQPGRWNAWRCPPACDRSGTARGGHRRRIALGPAGSLGSKIDRNQCAGLFDKHSLPRAGAACRRFVLSAPWSAGASGFCGSGGGSSWRARSARRFTPRIALTIRRCSSPFGTVWQSPS